MSLKMQSLMEFKKYDPSEEVMDEFNLKLTEDIGDCFRSALQLFTNLAVIYSIILKLSFLYI